MPPPPPPPPPPPSLDAWGAFFQVPDVMSMSRLGVGSGLVQNRLGTPSTTYTPSFFSGVWMGLFLRILSREIYSFAAFSACRRRLHPRPRLPAAAPTAAPVCLPACRPVRKHRWEVLPPVGDGSTTNPFRSAIFGACSVFPAAAASTRARSCVSPEPRYLTCSYEPNRNIGQR